MKTVFLHVGEPKCGTTFLQDVLWHNRGVLGRQGVSLPGLSESDHFRAAQDLREVPQAPDDPAGSWVGEWDLLARQAHHLDDVALISHELLSGADEEQAAHAIASLAPADVHLILTVRDMASLLPAEWQETVKHRNRRSWDGWLKDVVDGAGRPGPRLRWFWKAHDTLAVLERWSASLPPDHVHVVTLPRRGAPPDTLWRRFAGVIGVDPGSVNLSNTRPNASLGVAETELLVRLNRLLPADIPNWYYFRAVKAALVADVLAPRPSTERLRLPAERFAWAQEYGAKVRAGLEAAGYDIVGDLDELLPDPAMSGGLHPSEVDQQELLDASLACVVALLEQGFRDAPGGPLARAGRTLRAWSTRYPLLGRLRIGAAHVAERVRTRRLGS